MCFKRLGAWFMSWGTLNPFELLAMASTWTGMPAPPQQGEQAYQCLERNIGDYDGMAKRARFKYVVCRWSANIASAAIPILAVYAVIDKERDWPKIWTAILGALVLIING